MTAGRRRDRTRPGRWILLATGHKLTSLEEAGNPESVKDSVRYLGTALKEGGIPPWRTEVVDQDETPHFAGSNSGNNRHCPN